MFGLADGLLATLAGFGGGILLGLAARVGRYCIMGAVYGADLGRMRMLAMSAAVAIAGTFGLIAAGVLDPDLTRYFSTAWSPAGSVIGGLMFGWTCLEKIPVTYLVHAALRSNLSGLFRCEPSAVCGDCRSR